MINFNHFEKIGHMIEAHVPRDTCSGRRFCARRFKSCSLKSSLEKKFWVSRLPYIPCIDVYRTQRNVWVFFPNLNVQTNYWHYAVGLSKFIYFICVLRRWLFWKLKYLVVPCNIPEVSLPRHVLSADHQEHFCPCAGMPWKVKIKHCFSFYSQARGDWNRLKRGTRWVMGREAGKKNTTGSGRNPRTINPLSQNT